jgi:hypothetical protein
MKEIENFDIQFEFPEGYPYHINQVVRISDKKIHVLKRNFSIKTPYKLEEYSTYNCKKITYKNTINYIKLIFGLALIMLVVGIFYYLGVYWNELQSGTTIRFGLFLLAAGYGVHWVFGSRRHKLTLKMQDGKVLKWVSGTGDYKYRLNAIGNLLEKAKLLGIEVTNESKSANKSLKVCSSLRFVTDSPNRRMLRIICAACVCPLALR